MGNSQSTSDIFTACYIRDKYTCQDCGSTENLEVHHLLPISQGGKNTLNNLKTVCHDCHVKNYKDVHYPKDKSKIIPFENRGKSRYGIDKSRNTQIIVGFPNEIVEEIEQYWHDNKLKSRSEAIRQLVEKSLSKEKGE